MSHELSLGASALVEQGTWFGPAHPGPRMLHYAGSTPRASQPFADRLLGGEWRVCAGGAYDGRIQYDLPPLRPDVMAETAQLSGRSLRELAAAGERDAEAAVAVAASAALPARAAAAQAALQRAQAAAGSAAERVGGAPSPPLEPSWRQQQQQQQQPVAEQREYRKGDLVWYRERDGRWRETQVGTTLVAWLGAVQWQTALAAPLHWIQKGRKWKCSWGSFSLMRWHRHAAGPFLVLPQCMAICAWYCMKAPSRLHGLLGSIQ